MESGDSFRNKIVIAVSKYFPSLPPIFKLVTVKNFTISLYAFHLRHTLTYSPEVVADANLLWENLAKLGEGPLPFPGLRDLRSKLVCYQNGKYEPEREQGRETEWLTDLGSLHLGSIPTAEAFKIKASLQPFRLNDTYAVDLTLSPESENISIDLPQLQLFKSDCLLPSNIQASLGQTLWIYGEVDATENCEALAERFAVALLAGTNLNLVLINISKLFGSLFFEYQVNALYDLHKPGEQFHILVSLNNYQAPTAKLAEDAYDWILNLLCCYHKILFAYDQFRWRYIQTGKQYREVEQESQYFIGNLSRPSTNWLQKSQELLIKLQVQLFECARNLHDLENYRTTISINMDNYKLCLDKIRQLCLEEDNLGFLEDFHNYRCHKFQQQIQIDLSYLTSSYARLQQMLQIIQGSISGIVAIDRAERTQRIQGTIQSLGWSTGTGVISTVLTSSQPIQLPFAPKSSPPFQLSLSLSLLLGIVVGGLTWLITKQLQRRGTR
ncbi:hypothetical protein NIES4073_46060 [Kalymmatonema gypsitolerans NIES-4073]|nr:hypothetical protein NIES4073_46060 [Scytonema sp. NIES-4073]